MELLNKIDGFAADIYFNMPHELKKQYTEICFLFSDFLDAHYANDMELMKQKQELLQYLLKVLESNDFIKMADALTYDVRPIVSDTLILLHKQEQIEG